MLVEVERNDPFGQAFKTLVRERAQDPLLPLRRQAFARFAARGFPTMRDEAWKYTNLATLSKMRFDQTPQPRHALEREAVRRLCYGDFDRHELVFVDGRFEPTLSTADKLPGGTQVMSLADAMASGLDVVSTYLPEADRAREADHPSILTSLNTAFMADGAFIHVPREVRLARPIHLVFISTGSPHGADTSLTATTPIATHPRNVIIADAGSHAAIVESYVSEGGVYFTNAVTDIFVGEDAHLDHYKIQRESGEAFHLASLRLHPTQNCTFRSFFVSTGGRLVRNEIDAPLEAEGISCKLYGLFLLADEQHVDCHTLIDHLAPRCQSEQIYKGILDGKSHGVFSGTVVVREDAQKTDAHQINKNLLLSEDALVNTRPQLQIHADDVKCTHGVAIGSLDESQLFYLLTRGIGPREARDMLTYAFASELLSKLEIDAVRTDVERRMSVALAADSETRRPSGEASQKGGLQA